MCSYFIACTYINYNYMPTHTHITPLFVYNNKITRYLNACNAIKYARLCVTVAGRSMPMAIMQLFAYTHFVFSRSSAALLSGARAHNSFLRVLFSLLLNFFPFFLVFFLVCLWQTDCYTQLLKTFSCVCFCFCCCQYALSAARLCNK